VFWVMLPRRYGTSESGGFYGGTLVFWVMLPRRYGQNAVKCLSYSASTMIISALDVIVRLGVSLYPLFQVPVMILRRLNKVIMP
jgi:hypothetical protein